MDIRPGPDLGSIVVTNAGPVAVDLDRQVEVQRLQDGQWIDMPVSHLLLRETCMVEGFGRPVRRCSSLAPGTKITTRAWTGYFCSSQCTEACHGEGIAAPGTYRFVIHRCGSGESYSSPEFALPAIAPQR